MSTGSLLLHQWIVTSFPKIVKSYHQFDDSNPFDPLLLDCAVPIAHDDSLSDKLTAVVTYYTQHKTADGEPVIISFGLGKSVLVNTIVGIPTIKKLKMVIDYDEDKCLSKALKLWFPLCYKEAATGLPPHINFNYEDFVRPQTHPPTTSQYLLCAAPPSTNLSHVNLSHE